MQEIPPYQTSTRTSEDGHEYKVLTTPSSLEIPGIHYSSSIDSGDGFIFHHFFVRCETLRSLGLPLDANPREPTRAKVVTEMASTLREAPDKFHHWNNGITVICDSIDIESDFAKLVFKEGSGICNGGHTYFTIVTYPDVIPESAFVHIEVIDIPESLRGEDRKHVINDIARNRNANRQLLPTTQADYLGYYEPFKLALGENRNRVIWHEGDSESIEDAIGSEFLIRMLASVDPFWYSHPIHSPEKSNHKACATGSRSIHNKWFEGQNDPQDNLRHMAPLTNDLFKIIEIVSHSLKNDDLTSVGQRWRGTNFYRYWLGEREAVTLDFKPGEQMVSLPNPAAIMFLGYFRSNIWLGTDEEGNPAFIGFLVNYEEIWDDAKIDLLKKLTAAYYDYDQDPNQFIKNNAPYENQLISLVYGQRPPKYPHEFYRIEDGVKFISDGENPTHFLECDDEGGATLQQYRTGDAASREQLYRLI